MVYRDGDLIRKDPDAEDVGGFDWGTDYLATTALILTSAWVIQALWPNDADTALTYDNDSIDDDQRGTQVRLLSGTPGVRYKLTNRITPNENPARTLDRSVVILIQDK